MQVRTDFLSRRFEVAGCLFLVIMPGVSAAKSNAADMRHAEMGDVATDIADHGNANLRHADMGGAEIDDADMGNADMILCLQRYVRLTLDLPLCQMCMLKIRFSACKGISGSPWTCLHAECV